MKDIQRKEFMRCVKFIEGVGCKFKIITDDGEEFGTLEIKVAVESKARTRSPSRYPYGALSSWYRPQLDYDAAMGTVQEVAAGTFEPEIVRSGICSDLTRAWGRESYVTNIVGNTIEVMRTSCVEVSNG